MGVKQRIEKLESKRPSGATLNPGGIFFCSVSPNGSRQSVIGYSILGTNINIMREAGESTEDLKSRSIAMTDTGRPMMFIELYEHEA